MGILETHCQEREKRGIHEARTPKGLRKNIHQKEEADQTCRAATRFVRKSSGTRGQARSRGRGQLHALYIKTGVRGQLLVSRNQEGEKENSGFSIQIMKDGRKEKPNGG